MRLEGRLHAVSAGKGAELLLLRHRRRRDGTRKAELLLEAIRRRRHRTSRKWRWRHRSLRHEERGLRSKREAHRLVAVERRLLLLLHKQLAPGRLEEAASLLHHRKVRQAVCEYTRTRESGLCRAPYGFQQQPQFGFPRPVSPPPMPQQQQLGAFPSGYGMQPSLQAHPSQYGFMRSLSPDPYAQTPQFRSASPPPLGFMQQNVQQTMFQPLTRVNSSSGFFIPVAQAQPVAQQQPPTGFSSTVAFQPSQSQPTLVRSSTIIRQSQPATAPTTVQTAVAAPQTSLKHSESPRTVPNVFQPSHHLMVPSPRPVTSASAPAPTPQRPHASSNSSQQSAKPKLEDRSSVLFQPNPPESLPATPRSTELDVPFVDEYQVDHPDSAPQEITPPNSIVMLTPRSKERASSAASKSVASPPAPVSGRDSEAHGAGLVSVLAGRPASFVVVARDARGRHLEGAESSIGCIVAAPNGAVLAQGRVTETEDAGVYEVVYVVSEHDAVAAGLHTSGPHQVTVRVRAGTSDVRDSPFTVALSIPRSIQTAITGPGLSVAYVGEEASFSLMATDLRTSESIGVSEVTAQLIAPNGLSTEIRLRDRPDGSMSGAYVPRVEGPHTISILFDSDSDPRLYQVNVQSGVAFPALPSPVLIDNFSPVWLTACLRAANALDANSSVVSFSSTLISEGLGFLSAIYRIVPVYRGHKGPASIIAKLPALAEKNRQLAANLLAPKKEIFFYKSLGPKEKNPTGFRVPNVFYAEFNDTDFSFAIFMDDLSHLRIGNQLNGASAQDARAVVLALADFHARWHKLAEENPSEMSFCEWNDESNVKTIEAMLKGSLPVFLEKFRPHMSEQEAKICADVVENIAYLMDCLAEVPSHLKTLAHFDLRGDNMFFSHGAAATSAAAPAATATPDSITIIDWQLACRGVGAFDVAYFLGQNLRVPIRRQVEAELLKAYHERLLQATGYSAAQYPFPILQKLQRTTLLFSLAYPIIAGGGISSGNEREYQLVIEMLTRALSAIADNKAYTLLQ
eukprot:TRINITY_DN6480_c0_g1_i2.p1 TRINITY_DN6480_c0_g1~~TRINITY_DN6480_c0_g1_i2.p1  ORF type:complete len:1021 (-),score=192.34 TRINITY_DN6480_c0_g1_i2:633-3695(-)